MFILRHLNNEGNHVFSKVWGDSCDEKVMRTLPPPFVGTHEVIGFCKGIFLLDYVDIHVVVVWNPVLSHFAVLPPPPNMKSPPCPYSHCDGTCRVEVLSRICGMGFDIDSGDCKVLSLSSNYYHHSIEYDHACLKQAQVYSLTNDCWEEIEIDSQECSMYDVVGYATYAGGFLYWMAEMVDGDRVIASFDLVNHKFSTIPTIPFLCSSYDYGYILTDFQGSVGLTLYERQGDYKILYPRVLVFKDGQYQWTTDNGFTIKVQAERPLGYMRDGKVLLLQDREGKLLVYDSGSEKLSKIDQLYDYPHCMQFFPLSQSFAIPLKKRRLCGGFFEDEKTIMVETIETSTTHGTSHLFCQLLKVDGRSTEANQPLI